MAQGRGPVDRLCHARQLEQVLFAQALNEGHHLRRETRRKPRCSHVEDRPLARRVRIIHPMVQAAAPDRVMHFAPY